MNEIDIKTKRTALVMGGGGSRGAYEIGVWQALKELGIRIDMVYGASVGAINAAMVAQGDVDHTADLWKEMETDMVFDMAPGSKPIDYVKEIVVNQGAGTGPLKELLTKFIDEEKVRSSGLDFGITAVSLPNFEGHYLRLKDIPEGRLIDYIMASASAFPALQAYEIDGVSYIDGGYTDVLPIGMAVEDGATDVIAVDLNGYGSVSRDVLENTPNLIHIKSRENLGFQLIFDRDNTVRIMKLGYLDCFKAFGIVDGDYLSFSKGTFDKTTMKMADNLGEIFSMDSLIIYTRQIYLDRISELINSDIRNANKLNKLINLKTLKEMIAFAEEEKLQEGIRDTKAEKLLCYAAAEDMRKNGDRSIFMTRTAMRMIPKVVNAAKFLIKFELVR
ncbi:MAG: patatin-like phospholipase family protein [Firmicutes bacterium]|nr:patatin-like phospholipase family protein [Bacillota bacterium]